VDPRSAPARYNLGVALKDAGDLAGAEAQWREALRLRPHDAETLTQLGTAAAVRGDLVTAEVLLRARAGDPAGPGHGANNLALLCGADGEDGRRHGACAAQGR
jgi:Flp pilus assembly protein TadD